MILLGTSPRNYHFQLLSFWDLALPGSASEPVGLEPLHLPRSAFAPIGLELLELPGSAPGPMGLELLELPSSDPNLLGSALELIGFSPWTSWDPSSALEPIGHTPLDLRN